MVEQENAVPGKQGYDNYWMETVKGSKNIKMMENPMGLGRAAKILHQGRWYFAVVKGVQLYGEEGLEGGFERIFGPKSMSKAVTRGDLCPIQDNDAQNEDLMLTRITVSKALSAKKTKKSKDGYSREKELTTVTHSLGVKEYVKILCEDFRQCHI